MVQFLRPKRSHAKEMCNASSGVQGNRLGMEKEDEDCVAMERNKNLRSQRGKGSDLLGSLYLGSMPDLSLYQASPGLPEDGFIDYEYPSEMDLMKEKFAKLLLGEDMSGGVRGVSSALALSNSITNLAASVFSQQHRLEPISPERKERWRTEIDWLLSVADHIVELVPCQHTSEDGVSREIMVTEQRSDLQINIPALKKLDEMLIGYLDNFEGDKEFWYVSKDADESEIGDAPTNDEKWWHPIVKVPPAGLSESYRKWLKTQKRSVKQILKAAMAINAQVLMEMEIPEAYHDTLPKNGRDCLGDSNYRCITDDVFNPEQFLQSMDLSEDHKVLDLKDRIEASVIIWTRKMQNIDCSRSVWGMTIGGEKRELFEERAQSILCILKEKFPGIPQSSLDASKIESSKDVGHSILESYSRILESVASTIVSMINDVLRADSRIRDPTRSTSMRPSSVDSESEPRNSTSSSNGVSESLSFSLSFSSYEMTLRKIPQILSSKTFSYLEKIETFRGLRSPTTRR